MQCPVDGRELMLSERHGIEIDYCPECRGVWLDRGELDKIIERSDVEDRRTETRETRDAPYNRRDDDDDRRGYGSKPKKRSSFLSEIFEFGG